MKKTISLILLSMLLITVLAGCGKSSITTGGQITEVTVWTPNSHSKAVMERLVNEYNKTTGKENGIKIIYCVKENNLPSVLESAFASGQEPDLFTGVLSTYASSGQIVAIEDIPGGNEYLATFRKEDLKITKYVDGKHYSVPFSATTRGLVYNKDMFKKYGIVDENGEPTPPKTYEEVRKYAKIMTDESKGDYGIILPLKMAGFYNADIREPARVDAGFMQFNPTTGRYDFSGTKALMELYLGVKEDKSFFPGAEGLDNDPARAQFAERNIGMKYASSFDVGVYNDQFPAKCDWGVAPLPVADINNRYKQSMSVGGVAFMTKTSVEKIGAEKLFEVFKWIHSDELAIALYKEGCEIPYKASLVDDINLDNAKAGWKEFSNMVKISSSNNKIYPIDISGEKSVQEVFLEDVWTGKVSVDDAILDLNKRYNKALESSLAKPNANPLEYYLDSDFLKNAKLEETD